MPQTHPQIGKIGHYEVRDYLDATTWAKPYSQPIRSSHFCYQALWRPQYVMQSLQVQICFLKNFSQVLSEGSLGRYWTITLFLELIVFILEVKTSLGHSCGNSPKQHGQGSFFEKFPKKSSHFEEEESYEITKIIFLRICTDFYLSSFEIIILPNRFSWFEIGFLGFFYFSICFVKQKNTLVGWLFDFLNTFSNISE